MNLCIVCDRNPASGDCWEPRKCAECIAAARQAADLMLARLYAISAYRCRWCGCAARHPHDDWCGRCEIPTQERNRYAKRIADRLGKAPEDILTVWDEP